MSVSLDISRFPQSCSLSERLKGGQPVWRLSVLVDVCLCVCVCVCVCVGGWGWLVVDTPHSQGLLLHHLMLSALSLDHWFYRRRECILFFLLFSFGHISFMMKSIFIFNIMTDSSTVDSSWSQFPAWSVAFLTSKREYFQRSFRLRGLKPYKAFQGDFCGVSCWYRCEGTQESVGC